VPAPVVRVAPGEHSVRRSRGMTSVTSGEAGRLYLSRGWHCGAPPLPQDRVYVGPRQGVTVRRRTTQTGDTPQARITPTNTGKRRSRR
jgi:hypothetical protein